MPAKQPEPKIRKSRNPITGMINIAGEPDSGKTWFAMSSGAQPERTAFIDDDLKGKAIVEEVEAAGRRFGYYRNLVEEGKGMRELGFHKHCLSILDEIEPGKFDVLIWDTWTHFENTFHPMVASNPNKYRQFYSLKGDIKGAEQWGASFEYEATVISALTEIVPLVVLTSHLKKDGSKRDVAESKKPLIQKARMRVFLRHSVDGPEPTGLMLKRLSKVDVGSGGMKPVNVTHRKVQRFTWETLLHYWENHVGNVKPGPDEQLNEFELSILDGILTKDQKDVLRLAVIQEEREREEEARQARTQKRILSRDGTPSTSITLLTKAFSEFEMDGEKVAEVLGLDSSDDVMELKEADLEGAWKKIRAAGR